MTMTVKKLINQLQNVENQFLEVEIVREGKIKNYEIDHIVQRDKKVFLYCKELKLK